LEVIFHLHGFDDQQDLAFGNSLSSLNLNGHDFAGHRAQKLRTYVALAASCRLHALLTLIEHMMLKGLASPLHVVSVRLVFTHIEVPRLVSKHQVKSARIGCKRIYLVGLSARRGDFVTTILKRLDLPNSVLFATTYKIIRHLRLLKSGVRREVVGIGHLVSTD